MGFYCVCCALCSFEASTLRISGSPSVPASPLTASRASPSVAERANLTRPLREMFRTVTRSLCIHLSHISHHSWRRCPRSPRTGDWSLSPHLAQSIVVPLVSLRDRATTRTPSHAALYSICLLTLWKGHEFVRPLKALPWPFPFRDMSPIPLPSSKTI